MREINAKDRRAMREAVMHGQISAFNYAFCRLILDQLLVLKANNMFTCSDKELVVIKENKRKGVGSNMKLRPKPNVEIMLNQLAVQMKWEGNFRFPDEVEDFIDAAQFFLGIFENPT